MLSCPNDSEIHNTWQTHPKNVKVITYFPEKLASIVESFCYLNV